MKNFFLLWALFGYISLQAQDTVTLINDNVLYGSIVKTDENAMYFLLPDKKDPSKIPLSWVRTYKLQDPERVNTLELKGDPKLLNQTATPPPVISVETKASHEIYCNLVVADPEGAEQRMWIEQGMYRDSINLEEDLPFSRAIDALNYLSIEKGWVVVSMFEKSTYHSEYHYYLLKKEIEVPLNSIKK